jgi:hypothetical protein
MAALEDAEACIKLKPDWAKGYSRMGAACVEVGALEEAVKVGFRWRTTRGLFSRI